MTPFPLTDAPMLISHLMKIGIGVQVGPGGCLEEVDMCVMSGLENSDDRTKI